MQILPPTVHYLTKVDIATDDKLIEQYGTSIPVLVKIDKKGRQIELFWPFDKNKVSQFLGSDF